MSLVVENSLDNSMSYDDYRLLVKQLVASNSTTGNSKTEYHVAFTKLNRSRMKRWDKTVKLSEESQKLINEFKHSITWLVILESWSGDSAHILPVLNKIAEFSEHIDIRIVLRDENIELVDTFLPSDSQAIPKLLMIDNESLEVFSSYGPMPSKAASYVKRFLARHKELTPEFKEDLQHWYNDDKGQNIIADITKILSEFEPNVFQ